MKLARLRFVIFPITAAAVVTFVVAAGVVVLSVRVSGTSMEPTLQTADRVVANPLGFDPMQARLRIVVGRFRAGGPEVIKRVIGVPGDRVKIVKPLPAPGAVMVQPAGVGPWFVVDNPAWADQWPRTVLNCCSTDGKMSVTPTEQVVPAGHLFVIGDNMADSDDSRAHGWLIATAARGIAEWQVFPFSKVGAIPDTARLIPSS